MNERFFRAHRAASRAPRSAELDVDELLDRFSPFRLMREGKQRPLEMGDRLTMGRPRQRFVACLLKVGGRLGPALSPERVVRQALDVFVGSLDRQLLEDADDRRVERAPAVAGQARVRHFLGQRVLEHVFQVREEPGLVQELGGLEVDEAAPQLRLRSVGDRREHAERHVLADGGRTLQQPLLLGRQPVNAGGQHRLDRLGNLNARVPLGPAGMPRARRPGRRSRPGCARSPRERMGCPRCEE